MAPSGRLVVPATLCDWRKEGFLPPLSAEGRGQGRGKSYFWRQADILDNACAMFDLSVRYGRSEAALMALWLAGFSVSLPRLRRAWLHRARHRAAARVYPAAESRDQAGPVLEAGGGASLLMINALAIMSSAPVFEDAGDGKAIGDILGRACAKLGMRHESTSGGDILAWRLWPALRQMSMVLEASNLMAEASDEELRQAHRYMTTAARFFHDCAADTHLARARVGCWSLLLAERLGAPLFLVILVLLRSGQKALLEDAARRITAVAGGGLEERGRRGQETPALHF